jgi:hypothetical protein
MNDPLDIVAEHFFGVDDDIFSGAEFMEAYAANPDLLQRDGADAETAQYIKGLSPTERTRLKKVSQRIADASRKSASYEALKARRDETVSYFNRCAIFCATKAQWSRQFHTPPSVPIFTKTTFPLSRTPSLKTTLPLWKGPTTAFYSPKVHNGNMKKKYDSFSTTGSKVMSNNTSSDSTIAKLSSSISVVG